MAAPSTIPSSTVPAWATNAGTRDPVPLPSGLQGTGWVPGTVLPALTGNALWGPLADWCAYLEASSPGAGQWDVNKIAIYYTSTQHGQVTTALDGGDRYFAVQALAASTGLLVGTGGGTGQPHLRFTDADDTITALDLASGDEHWSSTAAGGFVGPRASAEATRGFRWNYPSADLPQITYALDPRHGGWSTWATVPSEGYPTTGVADDYFRMFNLSGGSRDYRLARSLCPIIVSNGEWDSGATYVCKALSFEYDVAGAGQDVTVTLAYFSHAAPDTLVMTSATATATTGTGTASWTGSLGVVPQSRDYFLLLDIEQASSTSYSSGIRRVSITIEKYVVE